MSLVPKSVILNNPEHRNVSVILLYLIEFGSFGDTYVKKWLKIDPYCLQRKSSLEKLGFINI